MTQPQSTPVGRFAPSPTGPLHLGSLVAAVGSWLFARAAGGLWLMRMEDLDQPRVVPGSADNILKTLEQLGLEWDGPVFRQSGRTELYEAALENLRRQGAIYPCGCSRSDLARSASAPHPGEDGPAYGGACRDGLSQEKSERALRVRVTDEEIRFTDAVMGDYRQNLGQVCGDFVVKRKDGPFAYQLAVVVDDADMGVNQVVRGADLLSSTPRQLHLQHLLGLPTPCYAHLPLVTSPDGGKLSKRDNAVLPAQDQNLEHHGSRLIAASLRFLGQELPPDPWRSTCRELLEWAKERFDPTLIPCHPGAFIDVDDAGQRII